MGHVSWLKDLRRDDYLLPDLIEAGQHVVIKREALMSINAYETSVPTNPSAGRVYRRTYDDGITYMFIVEDAPPDDPRGGRLHHPLTCLILE